LKEKRNEKYKKGVHTVVLSDVRVHQTELPRSVDNGDGILYSEKKRRTK
jgi:hypothetical protein